MKRLNIACGSNIFPGWINIDRTDLEHDYLRHLRGLDISQMGGWPEEQIEHSRAITEGRLIFVQRDLRKGFPDYEDGTVDAIYVGQAVEHLNRRTEIVPFLRECFRLLKPGGRIRITTPEMAQIIEAYQRNKLGDFAVEQPAFYKDAMPLAQLSYLLFGASGDGCTQEHYDGHFHVYSWPELFSVLQEVGFVAPTGQGKSDVFADCIDKGMSHSMGIEAIKPKANQ